MSAFNEFDTSFWMVKVKKDKDSDELITLPALYMRLANNIHYLEYTFKDFEPTKEDIINAKKEIQSRINEEIDTAFNEFIKENYK